MSSVSLRNEYNLKFVICSYNYFVIVLILLKCVLVFQWLFSFFVNSSLSKTKAKFLAVMLLAVRLSGAKHS